jgi:Eukaryotic-type carbonic anhydrase
VSRCGYRLQVAAYNGSPLLLRYQQAELGIENTGHVVQVPTPADVTDTLQINGTMYPMVQCHFHGRKSGLGGSHRAAHRAEPHSPRGFLLGYGM